MSLKHEVVPSCPCGLPAVRREPSPARASFDRLCCLSQKCEGIEVPPEGMILLPEQGERDHARDTRPFVIEQNVFTVEVDRSPRRPERESTLVEAQRLVHGDRQADYGHPLDDFSRTAAMWGAILGVPVTAEQVALCMIAVKLSRQVNHPKRDNMVDAAGYAETCQMVIDERARRRAARCTCGPGMACSDCPPERGAE